MKQFVNAFCALLGSSLVVVFYSNLNSYITSKFLLQSSAVFLASIIAVLSEKVLTELPIRYLFFRKHILPLAEFEGTWLQIQDNNSKKYALCKVEYNKRDKSYSFYGTNYAADRLFEVKFNSHNICYEKQLCGFSYLVEGQQFSGEFLKCWGYISFSKNVITNAYDEGKGCYVEMGSKLERFNFFMEKIPNSYLKMKSLSYNEFKHLDFAEFTVDYFSWKNENRNKKIVNKKTAERT